MPSLPNDQEANIQMVLNAMRRGARLIVQIDEHYEAGYYVQVVGGAPEPARHAPRNRTHAWRCYGLRGACHFWALTCSIEVVREATGTAGVIPEETYCQVTVRT